VGDVVQSAEPQLEQQQVGDLSGVDPALAIERPIELVAHVTLGPVNATTVLALALPTIVEQVLHVIVGLSDTIIAGHLPGDQNTRAAAAAAVGVMSYFQWFVGLMTSAFGVGATAIIARSIGARNYARANTAAGTAISGAFLTGLAVAAVLFAFAPRVVALAGLRDLAAVYGEQFLRIMVITIGLQTAGQIGMASLRGAGDTFRPMLITAGVAVVNVVVALTLAFGLFGAPAMGIRGIALGTMTAYLLGGLTTVVLLLGGATRLRLMPGHFRIERRELANILRIGMPSWLEGMLLWIGQFGIVIFVINPTDLAIGVSGVTMAAHGAVLRIESMAFLPGFGFGIAAAALVGQYLGAGRADESRRAARLANRLALLTMTVAAVPMVVAPGGMLSLLIDSPPVVRTGLWPMVLAGLAQPGFAVAIVMGSALKGAGETIWPMLSTIVGMFAIRVPAMLIALHLFVAMGHRELGLVAVWVGILVDLNARGLFNLAVFARGRWRHKRV